MLTETVNYADENITASLEISEANVLIGMRRSRMRWESQQAGETDVDRLILRISTYPDLLSATVAGTLAVSGKEFKAGQSNWLPFEDFLALPDKLVVSWEAATYRKNPHWAGTEKDPKDKSELTPSPSDSQSISTPRRHRRKPKKNESRK